MLNESVKYRIVNVDIIKIYRPSIDFSLNIRIFPYFIPNIAAKLSDIDDMSIDVITICLSKINEINKNPIIK